MTALPELSEDEHQALDLLEGADAGETIEPAELESARAQASALLDRFVPAVARMMIAAVAPVLEAQRAHLEHKDRVFMAIERVTADAPKDAELAWLDAIREIPVMALLQDDASASALAGGALIDHLHARVNALAQALPALLDALEREPERAWGFSPAIATTVQLLAVPRESMLESMLDQRAALAREREDPTLTRLARIVTRFNRAAYLQAVAQLAPEAAPARATAPELVVFRIASVRAANNEVRARALAADVPERIDLARVIANREGEPARAIQAFGDAVAAAIAQERQLEQPRGRRFTWLHLTLLVILLALTAWHYWLR